MSRVVDEESKGPALRFACRGEARLGSPAYQQGPPPVSSISTTNNLTASHVCVIRLRDARNPAAAGSGGRRLKSPLSRGLQYSARLYSTLPTRRRMLAV